MAQRGLAGSEEGGANIPVAANACPCCRPHLAFGSGGQVHVLWRKVFPGDIRDMAASTSSDGGNTFGAPVRIAEDNWKINGCPESGPAAATVGNRLYVAWMTEAQASPESQAGVKLTWSDDGAKSFAPAILVSKTVLDANHPALSVAQDGRVALVFQGRNAAHGQGWTPSRPWFVEIDSGGRISEPVGVPANSKSVAYPTVAAGSAGRVFVAWTEHSDTASAILLSRARKSPE